MYDEKGEAIPVPENELPVKLPEDINFDKPGNPLDRHIQIGKRLSVLRNWKRINQRNRYTRYFRRFIMVLLRFCSLLIIQKKGFQSMMQNTGCQLINTLVE